MQIYLVGGAVRDALLGLPVQDRDWVVVGATPDDMHGQGYLQVGKDFPVFLHPTTHEEYALARTERKIAKGYHGFAFDTSKTVTLEQDLARRDLTINAMAQDNDGNVIDPFRGQEDLSLGILRHVSDAFKEDPVRILRLARFAARYDFQVAAETLTLMQQMTADGEVDALVAERVWQELSKALFEPHPERFFLVLHQCGALEKILPPLAQLMQQSPKSWQETMRYLQDAYLQNLNLAQHYALLCSQLTEAPQTLHDALRVPTECRDSANLIYLYANKVLKGGQPQAESLLSLWQQVDALRRPQRWQQFWQTLLLMANVHTITINPIWNNALKICHNIDTASIIAKCEDKKLISQSIHDARLQALESYIKDNHHDKC